VHFERDEMFQALIVDGTDEDLSVHEFTGKAVIKLFASVSILASKSQVFSYSIRDISSRRSERSRVSEFSRKARFFAHNRLDELRNSHARRNAVMGDE
jgi:hypothetical protein